MSAIGRALRGFAAFWWEFIVGDDWRVAAGVVAALAVTAFLAAKHVPAWWFLPLAVLTLLTLSVAHAVRGSGQD